MRSHDKYTRYQSALIFCSAVVAFCAFILQKPFVTVFSVGFLSVICFCILVLRKSMPSGLVFLLGVFSVVMLPGLLKVDHGLSNLFYFYLELVLVFLSWYAGDHVYTLYRAVQFLFYGFLTFVCVSVLPYLGQPEPLSHILPGSQNGAPSYLIILLVTYSFLAFCLYGKVLVLPTFFVFFVSYLGEGRGSVLVSAYMILTSVVFGILLDSKSSFFRTLILRSALLVFLIVVILLAADIYGYISSKTKLSVGLQDQHRMRMLISYFGSLDVLSYLTGKGYEDTIIGTHYNSNPHISYIRLHSFFGLISVLLVLASPLFVFLKGFSAKNIYLFSLLFAALLRASTEPVLFPTLLDFFYFSCLFFLRKPA